MAQLRYINGVEIYWLAVCFCTVLDGGNIIYAKCTGHSHIHLRFDLTANFG